MQSINKMNGVQMMTDVRVGGRAWCVIESVFLHSSDNKGVLGMSRGLTPRHAKTVSDLGFAIQNTAPLFSGLRDHRVG